MSPTSETLTHTSNVTAFNVNALNPVSSYAATPVTATSPVKWDVDKWRRSAACSSLDTNLFFPDPEGGPETIPMIASAKAVCAECPVKQSCLEFAIRTRQLDGVWGGHTPEERRSIRRRRQAAARRAA